MQLLRRGSDAGYQYRYFGGFRLVLAALVMLQHFSADLAPAPLALTFAPYAVGGMAVLAFFALSGFVITEAVDCVYRDRPGAFLTNRLLRIVPHFLLAVALSMLAHAVFRAAGGLHLWRSQPSFPADAFAASNIVVNFFGFLPIADRFIDYNFLDIAWAIRVEMAFYIVMFVGIAISRKIPGARGIGPVMGGVLVLLAPLFYLAVQGRGVAMLAFVPYFAFGGGLYLATNGIRGGWLTVFLSVPAMMWQCVLHLQLHRSGPTHVMPPSMAGNLIVLISLLSIMTALAFTKFPKARHTDRVLGNLTYPLYLYHENVLITILTFTIGYSYGAFIAGILLSLLTAAILMALVDPLVTRLRDRVRGRSLQQDRGEHREQRSNIVAGQIISTR